MNLLVQIFLRNIWWKQNTFITLQKNTFMENLRILRTVYPEKQPKKEEWMKEFNIGSRIPRTVNYESTISAEKWYEMIQKNFLTVESVNS